jgi:hypothetical protein
MELKTYTVLTLMVVSSTAFAWQPLTYPVRSQSPYQRSIDTAMCYAQANKQTNVDMRRESQIPPRAQPVSKNTSTGVPSRPPLPSSSFSPAPMSASMPAAATAPGASEPMATAATGASAAHPASAATTAGTGTTATAPTEASAATADIGASGAAGASTSQANAAPGVKLPPLPAPEPPMTQYWAAYSACMQARGYVVQ